MTLSLVIAWVLAARPLSAAELASVEPQLDGRQAITSQAFETSELSPETRYWFVPAQKDGDFLGVLLDSEKTPAGRLVLDTDAHERLVSFDAVAFVDANEDGFADVVAVARVKSGEGPAKRKALLLFQEATGFAQDFEKERGITAALGERLTVARIRERLRPPLLSKVTVSCRSLKMPIALSQEGLLAFSPGDRPPLWNLLSGEVPSWVTPRLQTAIERIYGPACEWVSDESMSHGGRPDCTAPIPQLNDVLSGVQQAPTFADAAGVLGASPVSLRGSTLYVEAGAAAFKPGRSPLPEDCAVQGHKMVGALESARGLVLFFAPEDATIPDRLYTDPEEAEECYRSGGTCVQDIVPVPAEFPVIQLMTIRPAR